MKGLSWIALTGALLGSTCFAGWIDQRESPVMRDVLQQSGVQTQVGTGGESIMKVTNISCVHSYKVDGNDDGTTSCTYKDNSDSKAISLADSGAKIFFELGAHFGGNLNQYDQNGIRYQDFTADFVRCELDVGPDEPWLCEVSDQ